MKKILRLVTTSVLTLTLVACGEASSSVSSSVSSTPASSSVSSVSSAYANVTTVTLSAATATLTQVLGAQRRVTVTAALNANTNPNLALEWFVNGVKSNQTGRVLEYVPTEAGAFVISAKVGNISSNNLTVNVTLPTLSVEDVEWASASQILVTAPGGAEVTVSGNTVADSSYYDLAEEQYVINLGTAFTQGQTATLTLAREGETAFTQTVTYDTREFKLASVKLDNDPDITNTTALTATGGVYTVVRPFDENEDKTINIALSQTDFLTSTSQEVFRKSYVVPAGATAINSLSQLANSNTALTDSLVINEESATGTYVMTYTLGSEEVSVNINVVEAQAEIVIVKDSFKYDADDSGSYETTEVVEAGTDGVYEIVKPFASLADDLQEFELKFLARHFDAPAIGLPNQLNVTVSGPSTFSNTSATLFSGINTLNTGTLNTTDTEALNAYAFKPFTDFSSYTFGANATSALITFTQNIDSGTPAGLYEISMAAGQAGSELTKTVRVRVVEPTPKIEFVVDAYGTANRTIEPVEGTNNTYTIEKPSKSGITFNLGLFGVLSNYQSKEVTDATLIAADQLRDAADRLLFTLNNKYYNKVDISVAQTGPAVLFPELDSDLYDVLLATGKDGLIIVNKSAEAISDIDQALTEVEIDQAFDFDGASASAIAIGTLLPAAANERAVIPVTSSTVAGTYTLTINVDDLSERLTLVVTNPTPKIMVMKSSTFNTDVETLTFRSVSGTLGTAGDKDSVAKDNVFEVELGLALEEVKWRADLGVKLVDLTPGTYQYQVTKKYPSGVELDNVYSKTVVTGDIDADGTYTGSLDADWSINETTALTTEGDYVYTFRFGTTTKTYTIRVLPSPQLEVSDLKIDTTVATLHNGSYRLIQPAQAMTARAISIDFAKLNLVGATHYSVQVTLEDPATFVLDGSLGTAGVNITGKTANTTAAELVVKAATPTVAFAFGSTNTISLGNLKSAGLIDEGELVIYTIRFYKTGTTNLEQIGEVDGQQIKVKATA
jgi:hypothetical protein